MPRSLSIAMLQEALAAYEIEVSNLQRMMAEQPHVIAESRAAVAERDAMVASTSWRITRPLRALVGILRGDQSYWDEFSKVLKRRRTQTGERLRPDQAAPTLGPQQAPAPRELRPLPTYAEPLQGDRRRVTLVVDTVHALGSDETAVTAALAAVMLAQRSGWGLRVVTREADVDPDAFSALLRRFRISHRDDVEFEVSPPIPFAPPLGVTPSDYFIAPADSGAWSIIPSVDPSRLCIVLTMKQRLHFAGWQRAINVSAATSACLMPDPDRQRFAALMRLPGPRILVADAPMPAEGLTEVTNSNSGPMIPLSLNFAATEKDADWAALLAPALDCLNWR